VDSNIDWGQDILGLKRWQDKHPDVDLQVLTLYTNAVPFGVALLLGQGLFGTDLAVEDRARLIADVIELVVPIRDRQVGLE